MRPSADYFDVTERQVWVLRILDKAIQQTGRSPTVRELTDLCEYNSTYSVTDCLRRLAKKGMIRKEPRTSRGLSITALGKHLLHYAEDPDYGRR